MKSILWHNLKLCAHGDPNDTIADAAIAVNGDGTIAWTGRASDVPAGYVHWPREDLRGAWVTPGLVDCHTHLVYGGQRADEFAQRLAGASYEEIARRGGGVGSMRPTTRGCRAWGGGARARPTHQLTARFAWRPRSHSSASSRHVENTIRIVASAAIVGLMFSRMPVNIWRGSVV